MIICTFNNSDDPCHITPSKPQEQLLHAGVGGAECGVHYFEFMAEK